MSVIFLVGLVALLVGLVFATKGIKRYRNNVNFHGLKEAYSNNHLRKNNKAGKSA
jgi:hypothetical protein